MMLDWKMYRGQVIPTLGEDDSAGLARRGACLILMFAVKGLGQTGSPAF